MEIFVVGNGKIANETANKVVNRMLQENSRQLFAFTRAEFDRIMEYDVLNIMAFYYSAMNAEQKSVILKALQEEFALSDLDEVIDNLAIFVDDELYMPLSCKLVDRLGDSTSTAIIYETLFTYCTKLTKENWDQDNSYSHYLILLNVAYFTALSCKLRIKQSYTAFMHNNFGKHDFEELVESLYEKYLDNLGWDRDVELDVMEQLIDDCRKNSSFDEVTEDECLDAVERMQDIRREYADLVHESDAEGFNLIVQRTGIREVKCVNIQGFECHFCDAKTGDDEYIIIYQKECHINDIIDKEEEWSKFQREVYHEDIRQNNSRAMVYIIYILDDNSDNIPIQVIESNRTYGRKYVFTEEETITFINGIVRTSSDEIGAASPVQEWDRILREEHLTGCLTEAYAAKKVESYLLGERFDADYLYDDDYASIKHSDVPKIKWVKSLETSGFRDFCFDRTVMNFGQINLFYGANGSGKTSVLEAIEYALTSEVRRVKDFKIKMPTGNYPRLNVYDTEAGVHVFTPGFSKNNNKEIERVWYGVPIGRNKSNLNGNFNRFNAFDSEAAYKFIHESDNSEESFASMFGNLMFGETVVDHEKKWQRFKRAFDERYTELRSELSNARGMAEIYERSLASKNDSSKSEEIEKGITELKIRNSKRLPKEAIDRYSKLLEELTAVRKYVDYLSSVQLDNMDFATIERQIAGTKHENLCYTKQKKEKSEQIAKIAEEAGQIKQTIFDERENQTNIQQRLERVNIDISNWSIVQNVLSHKDTIRLVNNLVDEMTQIEREIYYIAKIEQRTAVINFLKLDDHKEISVYDKQHFESMLLKIKEKRLQLENEYSEAKKAYGEREQQAIELRKIGKTLLVDEKCPLCHHEYDSRQQLIDIIDSAVVVDDTMESLIIEIQKITKQIIDLEKILDRQKLIEKAKLELDELKAEVPMISVCRRDYKRLYNYAASKVEKEKRKTEIIEQQETLASQGFSLRNIAACQEYQTSDATYLEYKRIGNGTYSEFLQNRLQKIQNELSLSELKIAGFEEQIRKNAQKEEILRSEIHHLESILESLDLDRNREIEQALENLKTKFEIPERTEIAVWTSRYHKLFDKCELEVQRLESQSMISFERQLLAEYKETIKRDEPMVERCARAVQAFERMPSLSSFVEHGIRSNIQQISKFFKWMHHSGEFEKLDIDEKGIYAIRGLTREEVRTYEMSTGQRSTIAMAVMFALHMAAPDAPQFLLLDEPLATMDDTQVLNVLDILKSMAEQNTQIFFTTANGIMINLFKECFKNTTFDYKEYQFIKRVNRPSEIRETSINDTKTIEELTLDDLTLDFQQFAQIRDILRRNQEKLVSKDEWEVIEESSENIGDVVEDTLIRAPESFYLLLDRDEQKLLDILVIDQPGEFSEFWRLACAFSNYKTILEQINEKALDFYGETIINTDESLPFIEEEYDEELRLQHDTYYADPNTNKWLEEQKRLEEELQIAEEKRLAEEKRRVQLEEEIRKSKEEQEAVIARERKMAEQAIQESREERWSEEKLNYERTEKLRIQLEEQLQKAEGEHRKVEEQRKAEEVRRIQLEEQLQKTEEEHRRVEEQRKAEEMRRIQLEEALKKSKEEQEILLAMERKKVEDAIIRSEEVHQEKEMQLRIQLEEDMRKIEHERIQEEKRRMWEESQRHQLEETLKETEKKLLSAEEQSRQYEKLREIGERHAQELERQKLQYRQMNLCQHCGGSFTGIFNKKCRACGRMKDYS